jgi:serine/threonine protein kinase
VDKRTDIWAFGVVLLEMLTGTPVFAGDTVSHVVAAVLKDEPDWTRLPAESRSPLSGPADLGEVSSGSAGASLVLSGVGDYDEFGAARDSIAESAQGGTPDSVCPESHAMSRSSTWKVPRRRSGGSAASIVCSFSDGSARR